MKRPKFNIYNIIIAFVFMISVLIQGVRLYNFDYLALSGPIFSDVLWIGCLALFVFFLVLVLYYVPLLVIIKITLSFNLSRFKVNYQYIHKTIHAYHYVISNRDIYLVKQVFRC